MDSPCIKQTVCKVLKIFQYGKYLVAYVLNMFFLKFYYGGTIVEYNVVSKTSKTGHSRASVSYRDLVYKFKLIV